MLFFFPRGVLDEILNLIESVYEGFPSFFFYTCINYTVFFRFLSSELTYDNYCTCHSFINCIYQYIILLSIFFSVTSRAIVIFYFRFRNSNNCYYFFLCNVVCNIVYSYIHHSGFVLFLQHTIIIILILQSYIVLCFRL